MIDELNLDEIFEEQAAECKARADRNDFKKNGLKEVTNKTKKAAAPEAPSTLLDAAKLVRYAFSDAGTHIERIYALHELDKQIQKEDAKGKKK